VLQAIRDQTTYRIVRKIAAGGMGTVYEALQQGVVGFEKTVAVKTLRAELSTGDRFVKMFIQEAKLVAALVHENIVQIYQLALSDEGYFIVMEYVNGLSLHEFIQFHRATDTPVPRALAVFIASRIARGLAYAHSRTDQYGRALQIVHRDVCPKNVLITTEGLPKVTDFGVAVVTAYVGEEELQPLAGKIIFMAPEQAAGRKVDFRADIFALGAVFFELLSGERIRDPDNPDVAYAMASSGTVEWDRLPKDIPRELWDILEKCLALRPDERYESTDALAKDLEFYIYKDGYGPTIQALEAYMRKQFAYLYQARRAPPQDLFDTRDSEVTATVVIG